MKVVSYLSAVPARNNNKQKTELLINYAKGVSAAGDNAVLHTQSNVVGADVGVIQGWVYDNINSPHLKLRKQVIDTQLANKKFVVCADASLFNYVDSTNPYGYLRYSINGVFPTTGNYCDNIIDPMRWQQISKHLNITIDSQKNKGKTIVLCLQRNGGWSMGKLDVQDWIINTIKQIRKHSDRPIVVRPHPGDKKAIHYLNHRFNRIKNLPSVILSAFDTPMQVDLNNAWAVVNHNSSSIVGPIIQGHHAFITDPLNSQCAEVSHTDFSLIETPQNFDRQKWLERISMFHWNFEELQNGTCWRHMRNYCQ